MPNYVGGVGSISPELMIIGLIVHDEFDTDLSDDPYYDVDGEVLD